MFLWNQPASYSGLLLASFFSIRVLKRSKDQSCVCLSDPDSASILFTICSDLWINWTFLVTTRFFSIALFSRCFLSHPVCFFTICSDLWTGLSWSPLRPSAYPQYKAKRRCCRSPIKDSKIDFSDDWPGARKDSEIDMSDGWPGRQWPRWRHPDREWEKAPAKSDQHK